MTWHFFSVTFGALYIAVPSGLLDLTCAWQVPQVPLAVYTKMGMFEKPCCPPLFTSLHIVDLGWLGHVSTIVQL